MNSKSLRRLAADHGSLHTAGLPPNYLFPPASNSDWSSDLTSLDVLLAGPTGTPYANGVWRLHLDIPPAYPAAPPTAAFRTRLWHPNIDEATGAVCVETLKRDWSSTLKLRDVLVTISCLLIQPNPASALNEEAGKLATEDWNAYCRRAKLMTDIHAAVPANMAGEVKDAQMRGEDKEEKPKEATAKSEANNKGKGKARTSMVASVGPKAHQGLAVEDEENTRRRGETMELESDPESDWIPGPAKSPKPFATTGRDNIFGIKGLDVAMQLDTPPKKATPATSVAALQRSPDYVDDSDPFITVTTKRNPQSFSLRVPPPPPAIPTAAPTDSTTELLKFSDKNPFSAIQPSSTRQKHPLLTEFSWSWADADIMHDAGNVKLEEGATKSDVRKRMANDDFEKQRRWELKRFKKAGFDLERWNRGDFGPRVGIGRL
ncbi:ubiquitin-conjugating enzyme E2 S [Amniculicola lignicola CBS 123094]|uniref:Ubiquitin-conjugating enzyme E2 S n=1 Tax=Amniculicola lignicola CBS 123094 TaxID=1392246 RepID=A0A6A5WMU4_9PLEO|nr:ubiquitin-conjugating enzyme E2 S [Amniculicola lignicola CBS 123094]